MFEPNGRCLFTASQDYLQSLSWEPSKCHDSVYCQWKQVADMAICSNKLVLTNYSMYYNEPISLIIIILAFIDL
jgi:hypothetical protein